MDEGLLKAVDGVDFDVRGSDLGSSGIGVRQERHVQAICASCPTGITAGRIHLMRKLTGHGSMDIGSMDDDGEEIRAIRGKTSR